MFPGSASNQVNGTLKKNVKKQKVGAKITSESKEDSSRKGAHKLMNEGKKEMPEKKSKEQGVWSLSLSKEMAHFYVLVFEDCVLIILI